MSLQGLTALQKRFAAITDNRKMLGQVGLLGVREAKILVPRKTGNLGRSIRLGTVTETSAQIIAGGVAGVGYAKAVEFGTGPHVIVPRVRKALAWGGDRRLSGSLRTGAKPTHFARKVNHPGTRAKPFLEPGAKQAISKAGLGNVVTAAWNEAAP